jgi:uncharacterized protein with PIN domain
MHVKQNVRKIEKEVFNEIIICEHCKKEIEEGTELTVNQKYEYPQDMTYRDFHYCNASCLRKFLEKHTRVPFEHSDPIGFYFTEEQIN